jgi:hypothetical protein
MAQRHHSPRHAGPDTVAVHVCDARPDGAVERAVFKSSRADDQGWVGFAGVAERSVGSAVVAGRVHHDAGGVVGVDFDLSH